MAEVRIRCVYVQSERQILRVYFWLQKGVQNNSGHGCLQRYISVSPLPPLHTHGLQLLKGIDNKMHKIFISGINIHLISPLFVLSVDFKATGKIGKL